MCVASKMLAMMAKTKTTKKSNAIFVYLTAEEKALIAKAADMMRLSDSQYCAAIAIRQAKADIAREDK